MWKSSTSPTPACRAKKHDKIKHNKSCVPERVKKKEKNFHDHTPQKSTESSHFYFSAFLPHLMNDDGRQADNHALEPAKHHKHQELWPLEAVTCQSMSNATVEKLSNPHGDKCESGCGHPTDAHAMPESSCSQDIRKRKHIAQTNIPDRLRRENDLSCCFRIHLIYPLKPLFSTPRSLRRQPDRRRCRHRTEPAPARGAGRGPAAQAPPRTSGCRPGR